MNQETLDCLCVPLPSQVAAGRHALPSLGLTDLRWQTPIDHRVASLVAELLVDLKCGQLEVSIGQILIAPPQFTDKEGYQLRGTPQGYALQADTTWGALHAVTTLYQLMQQPMGGRTVAIQDSPRFPWRGLLIDVARHFISLPLLRRVVIGMSLLKLNVLHLHLSDDQAFRFGSEVLPNLPQGQFYSQRQLSELVSFAADHGVRVVPELDVPGHVTSWLVGYPELGFRPVSATRRFGVHKACLNPADERTYQLLARLFDELGEVFPDEYVHIGGDEVHPAWWREDPVVQRFMSERGFTDVRAVQNYFNGRVCEILAGRNKKVIGWDEVLHADMPNMLVQNWRGVTTRDRVLEKSLDCVMSAPYYLDLCYPAYMHYQYDPEAEQVELLAVEDAQQRELSLAHVAAGIQWTKQWRDEAVFEHQGDGKVVGGEACLWAELVDEQTLETRLWSRLPAVAERFWSPSDVVDVDSLYARTDRLFCLPQFQLAEMQRQALTKMGLAQHQIEVAMFLEPIKWYGRLLGEQALQARLDGAEMPQARPYHADTLLNRLVDFLSPESISARDVAALSDDALAKTASLWIGAKPGDWAEDVRAVIVGLARVGEIAVKFLQGGLAVEEYRAQLHALYIPHGEFMLAPIPALLARLPRGS